MEHASTKASTSYLDPAQFQPHRTPSNGSSNSGLTYASAYSSESQARPSSRSPALPLGGMDRAVAALPPRGDSRPQVRSQTLPGPMDQDYNHPANYYAHQQQGVSQPQWGAPPGGAGYGECRFQLVTRLGCARRRALDGRQWLGERLQRPGAFGSSVALSFAHRHARISGRSSIAAGHDPVLAAALVLGRRTAQSSGQCAVERTAPREPRG